MVRRQPFFRNRFFPFGGFGGFGGPFLGGFFGGLLGTSLFPSRSFYPQYPPYPYYPPYPGYGCPGGCPPYWNSWNPYW